MTSIHSQIFILAVAYFLGSIPFGLIFSHLFKLPDPRQTGSGATGATNILRSGNKLAAFMTLLFDALKGSSAVSVALLFDPALVQLAGIFVVVGHIWPIWLGFKGGKGIATALGVLIVLSWPVAVACIVTWCAMALLSRYSSLSSVITVLLSPFYVLFLNETQVLALSFVLAVLLMWTHRSNIGRLITGRENKIGGSITPNSSED
jgi:glycerol-3-phosphate acyltransferase PlsY